MVEIKEPFQFNNDRYFSPVPKDTLGIIRRYLEGIEKPCRTWVAFGGNDNNFQDTIRLSPDVHASVWVVVVALANVEADQNQEYTRYSWKPQVILWYYHCVSFMQVRLANIYLSVERYFSELFR